MLKGIILGVICSESFGFLEVWKIHETIDTTQEVHDYIKGKKNPTMVIKLDISKSYYKTN